MQKFRYKLNGSFDSRVDYSQLVPSFMYEVVPGDTLAGTIQNKMLSQPTNAASLNDVYYDHYMFYVPYRLVWPDWTAFISNRLTGNADETQIPDKAPFSLSTNTNVQAAWYRFFNKGRYDFEAGEPDQFKINWLPYWAYILIYNTFFRMPQDDPAEFPASGSNATPALFTVKAPGSDFHKKVLEAQSPESGSLDTTNVDTLRESLARDKFQRIRSMYGDKYTDFLKSMGVQTSWSILENPEMLGKKSQNLAYTLVSNTASSTDNVANDLDPLGQKGGYYSGTCQSTMGRKFFAEHGVVIGLQTVRINTTDVAASHPIWSKLSREDYWTPEFDSKTVDEYERALWLSSTSDQPPVIAPNFADYKYGYSLNDTAPNSGETFEAYSFRRRVQGLGGAVSALRDGYLNQNFGDAMVNFDSGTEGDLDDLFLGVKTKTNLIRTSPVSKFQKPLY